MSLLLDLMALLQHGTLDSVSRVGTLLLRRERLLSDAGLLAAGVRFTYGRGRSRRALLHRPLLGQQDLLLLGRHY